jgi:hypothetical protein
MHGFCKLAGERLSRKALRLGEAPEEVPGPDEKGRVADVASGQPITKIAEKVRPRSRLG